MTHSPETQEDRASSAPKPPSDAGDSDFRDHLTTADRRGRRRWLYPRKPSGRYYRWRTWVSWLLLAILFAGPFIRINGHPLLMLNIVERRFSILGQIFWPQDSAIFAVAMLLFLTAIIIFTAAFGRLWCGWTCPQTLLMEMVFRKIEYWIEGDAPAQRALHDAPWTPKKLVQKLSKHALFFALSWVIANTLLSYIIGSDALLEIITDDPRRHVTGLAFMTLFTGLFYAIFARFREQACTFICPYGRFQSTMLDDNSLVVAYDHKRGERRGRWRRSDSLEQRRAGGWGDCVDCLQCVRVCPTGIDIRDGTQMECVHCTACIDACDRVMDKLGRPRGLIRYASLNSIEFGQPFRFTARLAGYTGVLIALAAVLAVLVFTRSEVEATLLRAPGVLFQTTAEGLLDNLYVLKVINKTSREMPLDLKLENVEGRVRVMGGAQFSVRGEQLAQTSVLVELEPRLLQGARTKLRIGLYSNGRRVCAVNTIFVGPRSPATAP